MGARARGVAGEKRVADRSMASPASSCVWRKISYRQVR
jgi:hypothetical protein